MSNEKKTKNSQLVKHLEDRILPIAGLIPGLKDLADIAKRVIEIHEEKKNERIKAFCKELIKGNLTAESIHNKENPGYEIEFGDLLQACMNDSDSSKAQAYAQLTIALRFGELDKERRRHFVLVLKQLSFEDLELLRHALIASSYEIIPATGSTVLTQADVFNIKTMSPIQALSISTLRQLGLINEKGITRLGQEFIQSTYGRDSLTPESKSLKVWQKPPVAIFTTATKNALHDEIVEEFKKIRIRCDKLRIDQFSAEKQSLGQYKALILVGSYEGVIYGNVQNVARYNNDHRYQFVSFGYSFPHRHEMNFRISLHEPGNLRDKVLKAATSLEFITDAEA